MDLHPGLDRDDHSWLEQGGILHTHGEICIFPIDAGCSFEAVEESSSCTYVVNFETHIIYRVS